MIGAGFPQYPRFSCADHGPAHGKARGLTATGHGTQRERAPPTTFRVSTERSWRWRESNPRPSVHHQGFSGRSLLRFSQPRRSCKQDADRLSRCSMSRLAPRPGQAVILLADARHRVEGIPGLTANRLLTCLKRQERRRLQCAFRWHLLVCGHRIYEVTTATLGPLPLVRPPKSKPIAPY